MANDAQSSCKIKDNDSNSSKGRHSVGKESSTSGSTTIDTSGLRRSTREASLKSKMIPSPQSTRKSERLDKQMPTTPSIKRKSERIENKGTPSPPSIKRRSERIENKGMASPPSIKRKSERIENKGMTSPLRGAERSKKISLSGSSGSKNSDKSLRLRDIKQKKEKRVKLLTLETKEIGKSEKKDLKSEPAKNRRMDARAYRALFKKQSKKVTAAANHEEWNRLDKSSQGGSGNRGGEVDGVDECSEKREQELREESVGRSCDTALVRSDSNVHKFLNETLEDNRAVESSHPSHRHISVDLTSMSLDGDGMDVSKSGDSQQSSYDVLVREMINDRENLLVDGSVEEKLQTTKLTAFNEKTLDSNLEKYQELITLNRKRKAVDMDSDASAIIASKDICTPIADSVPSSPPGCERNNLDETCGSCCKRQRVDDDSTKEQYCSCNTKLNWELSDISFNKDRGNPEAAVMVGYSGKCINRLQQKESSVDLQSESDQNTCVVCKLGGKLLCCDGKGCRRGYHPSCLNPPFNILLPLGVWHCISCVRKKIESGVHSVSEGIESIWDEREVEVPDVNGLQKQKQFFVKYKGLAHVHNCWVSERQLLLEAPCLIEKFTQTKQITRWKHEWSLPHRLLQKRFLMSSRQFDECHEGHDGDSLHGHCEWLVKWRGLNYEHATWELESALFLHSPEGQSLIHDYETRRGKIPQRKKSSLDKLSQPTTGGSPGFDNNHLSYVNKLREFWDKGRNAVVIDDQERIIKVTAFILSLQPDACRPFLIVSTSAALYSWDQEFLRLAPPLDVVVYSGNKDMRESIRALEFYDQGGCPLFHVLITTPEVILMDIDMLECIRWEAVIVDECQHSVISLHMEHIKVLYTDRRLLVVNGQLKDTKEEYLKLLSLLDSQSDLNNSALITSSNDNISKLKERLSSYIAYNKSKLDYSRFLEYWVPARLSNVQIELYCAALLSNSMALRSFSKNGSEAIRDILISSRKCCDHPYIVDPSLQILLTKGLQEVAFLDVGIKASGKLQLLDMMLMEMRNRGLRVLVLFQSISGSGRNSLGDILDDFLRQRFGLDSYERLEMGVLPSKKGAALNRFNNKESGRFVFLLESRACFSSIKLLSVDSVIIFDSDWSPINNLKALQRISVDSQFEQIKVFRLYSSFTVEENVLILAKQNKFIDSLQNISRSTCHMLLMLGLSHLFDSLDKFHGANTPASAASISSEQSLLKDVVQEFLSILLENGEETATSSSSIILKAQQVGGTYSTSSPLPGELTVPLLDESLPQIFWTKLLEGKQPRWKYHSVSTQRSRKRIQPELSKKPEVESDVVKKQKVLNNNIDPPSLKSGLEKRIIAGDKEGLDTASQSNDNLHAHHAPTAPQLPNFISEFLEGIKIEFDKRRKLGDAQSSLHLLLKPQIEKLCQILQFSGDVKDMVEKFLKYVMNNHSVNREQTTMLQAFQISLCWTAASLLKHKVDHKESLALAKQHLNFLCNKIEVDYVYSLLRCLKNIFLYRTGNLQIADYPNVSNLPTKGVTKDHSPTRLPQSTKSNLQKEKAEVKAWSQHLECSDKHVLPQPGLALELKLALKDALKSIKEIQKKCNKQWNKLIEKQQEEKDEIKRTTEEQKAQLEKERRMKYAIIRTMHSNVSMRIDKLKVLDNEYDKRIELLQQQMEKRLKHLEEMQLVARRKLLERKDHWVEEVKSWAQVELLYKISSNEPGNGVKCLKTCERVTALDSPKSVSIASGHLSEEHSSDITVNALPGNGLGFSGTPEPVPKKAVVCSSAVETPAHLCGPDSVSDELNIMASVGVTLTGSENCHGAGSSGDDQVNFDSVNSGGKERSPDELNTMASVGVALTGSENYNGAGSSGDDPVNFDSVNSRGKEHNPDDLNTMASVGVALTGSENCNGGGSSGDYPVNFDSVNSCGKEHNPDDVVCSNPDTEVPREVPVTVSSSEGTGKFPTSPSSGEQLAEGSCVPDEGIAIRVSETVSSNDDLENLFLVSAPPSDEQIPDGANSSMPDRETQLGECETAPHKGVEVDKTNNQNDGASYVASDNKLASILDRFSVLIKIGQGPSVDHQDVLSDAIKESTHSQELSLVNSPTVQPTTTMAQGGPVPFSQAVQDECTPPSTSAHTPIGDTLANEMQNTSQEVEPSGSHRVDAGPSNQLNHEAPAIEPVQQIQLLSSADSHSGNNTSDLLSDGGVEHQLNFEGHTSNQLTQTPTQLGENLIDFPDQAVMQPSTSYALLLPIEAPVSGSGTHFSDTRTMPIATDIINPPIQPAPPVASRMPMFFYPDPLQTELERIRKETDQFIKIHEDTKLQLKSDCEKEIEEVVAQIRRKYETKIRDMEAEFLVKKKEMDANHNGVQNSKFLAEAFRFKCMDLRGPGPSGMQHDVHSSLMQHLVQSRIQQNVQGSFISVPSSASVSAPSLQTTSAPASNLQRTSAPASNLQRTPPHLTPPHLGSPHITYPPVQAFHHPSASLSSIPPITISIFPPPSGNLRVGSEIRAPAPHLLRSTAMAATSLPSLPRGQPSHQAPSNTATTLPLLPHPPPIAEAPAYLYGPHNRPQLHETVARSSFLPTSLPPFDLLMDIVSPNLPDLLQQPDLRTYSNSLNRSAPTTSTVVNAVRTGGGPDLVCLSDDD
ncbi:helicase protein MOM1-like isoform X2 [Juglans regia]|uniref:Helicase protein MOM1-like isoform X2 n=1 Tax=Juglans regia TaxID=51240 RepID=A0A6P9EPP6_JUGRE|nr:helicase protein MOM1-like isoform X2 [Juglans regia]